MSVFPDWQKHAVVQKRPLTGCVATGFQMILNAAGATGIDFNAFQDDFDLDKDMTGPPKNNFGSVAAAVTVKYPAVEFRRMSWPRGKGSEKLAFIEKELNAKRPLLISLSLEPLGIPAWHTMPVVDMDADTLTLLWAMNSDGTHRLEKIFKWKLVQIHDNFAGGDNVAYLEKC